MNKYRYRDPGPSARDNAIKDLNKLDVEWILGYDGIEREYVPKAEVKRLIRQYVKED